VEGGLALPQKRYGWTLDEARADYWHWIVVGGLARRMVLRMSYRRAVVLPEKTAALLAQLLRQWCAVALQTTFG
jgi:hypothetical protein